MLQEEFTRLYGKLFAYAYSKAGRYLRDIVLREDAASEAVNVAVDTFIKEGCYDEKVAKRRIQSSLRQSSRKRKLEPIDLPNTEEYQGYHGYKIKNDT